MARVTTNTWPVLSTTAIAALQDVAMNGSFVLNGPLVSNGSVSFDGYARTISFTADTNQSGAIFTITGYVNGVLTTTTVTGPNNTTVYSTGVYFTSVTGITSNDNVLQVSVGTGTTGYTNWVSSDYLTTEANIGVGVTATANINYSLQVTFDDVNNGSSPNTYTPVAGLTGQTTTQAGSCMVPCTYVRIFINSCDATGTLTASFLQQGVR